MRLGITLPHMGPLAGPEAIVAAAKRAEAFGLDSVRVADRLLYPVAPRSKYPVTKDGSLPAFYKTVLDPIETLTFVAGHTERIRLAPTVLDLPFYTPVVLARRLTTLDVVSHGRLVAGFGLGWSEDEFEAVGTTSRGRGAKADEFLRALVAIWTTDPVEFAGRHYRIPRSIIGPKPVQRPHPSIHLAAFVPAALKRAAMLADGWIPVGIPIEGLTQMIPRVRAMVEAAGRDPARFDVVVGVDESDAARQMSRLADLGVAEVYVMIDLDQPLPAYLGAIDRVAALARE